MNKINNNYNKKDYYKNHYNNYYNYHNYNNDDDRDILYLNIYCDKCNCSEIVRNNYKLSKYKILGDIDKLKKDKEIIEMAVNDPETLNNLKNLGVGGPNLKPKSNVIKVDQKTNQIKGN